MTTPYEPVTWSRGERITTDKLNDMTSNEEYLFEQTPRIVYNANSLKKEGGMKIIAGIVPIPIQAEGSQFVDVYFGTVFSSGCNPVVTATIAAGAGYAGKFTSIGGLDGTPVVDNRGVKVFITCIEAPIWTGPFFYRTTYINYIAVGW